MDPEFPYGMFNKSKFQALLIDNKVLFMIECMEPDEKLYVVFDKEKLRLFIDKLDEFYNRIDKMEV